MHPTEGPSPETTRLARRLASLRRELWAQAQLTQRQLGRALGGDRPLSAPTISSWESSASSRIPSAEQLEAYARFFATQRSLSAGLLPDAELTPEERDRYTELAKELDDLRVAALRSVEHATAPGDPLGDMWRFADEQPVTIVCSDVAAELRASLPRANPRNPDYEELYRYAELDALVEIFGHIRAVNPTIDVGFRPVSGLRPNDYTTHLVVLGGADTNPLAAELSARLELPVRRDADSEGAYFQVRDTDERFRPTLTGTGENAVLTEDVAHLYRANNPFNVRRRLTLCDAAYGRGILGAIRTLTHSRFRNRNERYIGDRFGNRWAFSILMRVPVVAGQVMTPDWTVPETLLHEWPPVPGT